MKLLLNENVYGWKMTGLIGSDGAWFIGFSKRPEFLVSCGDKIGEPSPEFIKTMRDIEENLDAD